MDQVMTEKQGGSYHYHGQDQRERRRLRIFIIQEVMNSLSQYIRFRGHDAGCQGALTEEMSPVELFDFYQ